MSIHIKPPPRVDQTDQVAEPDRQASRFDERGIALQTVIIMVVLLAIAGGIAAVLLTRGQQTAAQLENQAIGVPAGEYESREFCRGAGHDWDASKTGVQRCAYKTPTACMNAGGVVSGSKEICTIDGTAYRITK